MPTTAPEFEFVTIAWGGRAVRIEHAWIAPERRGAPLLIFLHEGLGSLAMWKDFPLRLCDALGWRGLVYSRPGYGRSSPREPGETWGPDFMHRQAHEVLPALLEALGVSAAPDRPWLLGHSDGGSIALLYATRHPQAVRGAVVMAPHIMVEPVTLKSIEQSRIAYQNGPLREGLARYHDDPDSAFWGWNRIWLDPAFANWRIDDEVAAMAQTGCPLLAVQGLDDAYGTLEQIRGIQRRVPHTQLLELPRCGHSPHRDQPGLLTDAIIGFTRQQAAGR